MDADSVRRICLALPQTTESIQWGDNLVFKVRGKIYAILALEPARVWLSLKSTPEESAQLTERSGVIPAPYLARAHWIALETPRALLPLEIKNLLHRSYELVLAKLPAKMRATRRPSRAPRARSQRA